MGQWDGKPLKLPHENRGQAFESVYENAEFSYTQPGLFFVVYTKAVFFSQKTYTQPGPENQAIA